MSAETLNAQPPVLTVIEIVDLHVSVPTDFWRPAKKLLHGLNLQVQQGEVFGFIGPNGAGKTTTLKAMLGLVRPTQGTVRIGGVPAHLPQARQNLGFLPERSNFSGNLTAFEMVTLQARLAGMERSMAKDLADMALAQVGLAAAAQQRLHTFSKGMLQRAALAQACVHSPDILILDEPMSGLDPQGRHDVRELIVDQALRGKTVFFSTHILADVERICDRVGILAHGRLQHVGAPRELAGGGHPYTVTAAHLDEATRMQAHKLTAQVQEMAASSIFTCSDVTLANRLLDCLRRGGATVLGVQGLQPSLEDLFLEAASDAPLPKRHR
jgi:ABC-2 type transport system ATP-binding protein